VNGLYKIIKTVSEMAFAIHVAAEFGADFITIPLVDRESDHSELEAIIKNSPSVLYTGFS